MIAFPLHPRLSKDWRSARLMEAIANHKQHLYLRSVEARALDALHSAISDGLDLITFQDVLHWFTHCCYCA